MRRWNGWIGTWGRCGKVREGRDRTPLAARVRGVDVHDMEGMHTSLASQEIEAAKRAHGVIDRVVLYLAAD